MKLIRYDAGNRRANRGITELRVECGEVLLCFGNFRGGQRAVVRIKRSRAQGDSLLLQAQFVFSRRQIQLRRFEIFFRDTAFFVQYAPAFINRSRIVNFRPRVEQGLLVFSIGFRNRSGDQAALAGPRFIERCCGLGALGPKILRLELRNDLARLDEFIFQQRHRFDLRADLRRDFRFIARPNRANCRYLGGDGSAFGFGYLHAHDQNGFFFLGRSLSPPPYQ